ncbi:outer membrane protein assembly factor BamB family protein [Stieleria varia]|uniref:Outer membrane biogenesis protein BamB n=1 Tax=Stieleria varia TaxID=2528005 RepID=A0A5C6B2C7_9BACT|nr:PQQ-binding-like beta-propeller repeat protein [Stieleria varia]TWU06293.1 outer membrane biogenesis protein BamB [Stieleria varia]
MPTTLLKFAILTFAYLPLLTTDLHADWSNWRGPNDNGTADVGSLPADLSKANMKWIAELPGKGCSTPIVHDQVIYLTAPVDGKDALLAFDWDGKLLWTTTFGVENAGKHRNGSGSNASPVTDGDAVFVYFKSGTLAVVDIKGDNRGNVRWETNLVERFGKDTLYWDHGTSPVLTKGHVIMARMHNGESWIAAFDKSTGEIAWKVARNYDVPRECDHGYTTPLVIEHNGRESLMVWGGEHVTIHNASDGELVWSCGNFNPEKNELWPAIATPVIVGDTAVICYGRNDRGIPRTFGIRLTGSGDVTETNHAWDRDDTGTFVPTPAVHQGHVIIVRDKGEVDCIDPATGETIWSDAFPKHRNKFYASPLIADGKLYAPREDGVVFVAAIADGGLKLLSENDMQEPVIGSPIAIGDRLFIRGEKHLYCLSQ